MAIDFDKNAVETFKLNFDVPIWQRDIKTVTAQEILDFCGIGKGELDVLDGSPPCQGFSLSGKRQVKDERNDLFKEFVRLIDGLQPKVFVMENVSGMIKGKMKGRFLEILQTLKSLNYNVKCKLMNAMWYNVPQSRERMIFIGVRNDMGIEPNFPEPSKQILKSKDFVNGKGIPLPEKYISVWKNTKPGESFLDGRVRMKLKPHSFDAVKIDPQKPVPTIKKQIRIGQSGLYHWGCPELINIESIKLLSSFPRNFNLIGKHQDQWARIGNSVPPKMMQAIAENIRDNILNVYYLQKVI